MSFTYSLSLTSNLHKVRNLVDDTDTSSYQLEDEEISSFLGMVSSDLYLAASLCLRKIAASKALVARRRKAGNYEEDLRDIVKGLLEGAKLFKELSIEVPSEATAQEVLTDFNYRELINNKALRNESLD